MRRSNNITGSAFIEFNSNKTARYFINEYNNKKINGHLFCLNWAKHNYNKKSKEKENTNNSNSYFTVSINK
jgi:RNA recognition motif-containing protein